MIASPSPRHVWRSFHNAHGETTGARCDRCGAHVVYAIDTRGPHHCSPRPQWLRDNPQDDRRSR